MIIEIKVPPLSESLASGTLLAWHKQVGDQVKRDETLVDLETDKVILEIPAAASGTLIEIRQAEGAEVKSDQVVAVIEAAGDAPGPTPVASPVMETSAAAPTSPINQVAKKTTSIPPTLRPSSPPHPKISPLLPLSRSRQRGPQAVRAVKKCHGYAAASPSAC